MASITLSDNVLNATETATVTFTFDADYALLPEKITVTGGTLSTPVAFPPGQSPAWQATFTPPPPPPRRTPRRWQTHIPPRHSGHRAHRLHDHRKQQCRGGARTERCLHR